MVAAKAGAKYIAPFVARANEVGVDGIETISKIAQTFQSHAIQTEILAASVRNGHDAAKAASLRRHFCHASLRLC